MQELSLNVLDVAQNSVSAGASLIEITQEHDLEANKLTITIADDGCGMTAQQVERVIDPFYTTRTTRSVGLGVPFFKMAAEMTGGSFTIESQVDKGTTVRAVFDTGHIDCMPVGDMCATICSLIQCNPDIDFVYRLITEKGMMETDTRQFRQILEGISLSEPQVNSFIKGYIEENSAPIL